LEKFVSKKTVIPVTRFKKIAPAASHTQPLECTESSTSKIDVQKTYTPYPTEAGWMRTFYSSCPQFCEGDDLAATCVEATNVLLASALTDVRLPGTLSEMTGLPFHFVAAVLKSMDIHDLWKTEWFEGLVKTLLNRGDFANVRSCLSSVSTGFWEGFYSVEGVQALMTLRERRLFGGGLQNWTDRDAAFFFGL
jgi:hypothetical protein